MDIAATIQTWVYVLTHPDEATFEQERHKPNANLTTALIWIVIAAVISTILSFVASRFYFAAQTSMMMQMFERMDLPPEARDEMAQLFSSGLMAAVMGGASVFAIILTPILFLIGVGILHLIARALGGTGDYGRYAYLLAVFQAPLNIALAVVGLVPVLGGCVAFFGWIYGLVLTYYATKVEQNLTAGRAIAVVVIPLIIGIVLFACVIIAVVGMFASLMNR
jgi:hypothetical protein